MREWLGSTHNGSSARYHVGLRTLAVANTHEKRDRRESIVVIMEECWRSSRGQTTSHASCQ